MSIFLKGNSMKTKTFEIDDFAFEWCVETPDNLIEYEATAWREWEILERKMKFSSYQQTLTLA